MLSEAVPTIGCLSASSLVSPGSDPHLGLSRADVGSRSVVPIAPARTAGNSKLGFPPKSGTLFVNQIGHKCLCPCSAGIGRGGFQGKDSCSLLRVSKPGLEPGSLGLCPSLPLPLTKRDFHNSPMTSVPITAASSPRRTSPYLLFFPCGCIYVLLM